MAGKFVLSPSGNQLVFNLLASGSAEVLLTSERHPHKADALKGIVAARFNAPFEAQYLRMTSSAGKPYFVLHAGNNEVIGTSELYSTWQAREEAITAVKMNAPGASVVDRTATATATALHQARSLRPRARRSA